MYEKNLDKTNQNLNLSLILFHNNVPNNTIKNITMSFQMVLNGGILLRKKTIAHYFFSLANILN